MKVKHYIKKYKLQHTSHFNHEEFIADLSLDFVSEVEAMSGNFKWGFSKFQTCISNIREKWDAISLKTLGGLPERLWNYFYATTVQTIKKEYFPEVVEEEERIKQMSYNELVEYLGYEHMPKSDDIRRFSVYHNVRSFYIKRREEFKQLPIKNKLLALDLWWEDYRVLYNNVEKERERKRQREWEQWRKEQQERRKKFFEFLFNTHQQPLPTESFQFMQLSADASRDDINKAYKKLSLRYHPDQGGSQDMFIKLTEHKNRCLRYVCSQG